MFCCWTSSRVAGDLKGHDAHVRSQCFVSVSAVVRRRGKREACPPHPEETDWSACSVTCGAGTRTRRTSHNEDCQLTTETQVCKLRDCGMSEVRLSYYLQNDLLNSILVNVNTAEFRYNAIQYNIILHEALGPNGRAMWVFVNMLEKSSRVITASHCILLWLLVRLQLSWHTNKR